MQAVNNLTRMTRLLSPANGTLVSTAFRQDGLVWQALEQDDLVEKALSRVNRAEPETLPDWSPATLALLALGAEIEPAALRCDPLLALDAEMQQRALRAMEHLFTTSRAPQNLVQAGLVALALRERYRLANSWEGLFDLSSVHVALSNPAVLQIWRTALACLYGLVPDPRSFLRALVRKNGPAPAVEWACHCILCTPQSLLGQVEIMADLLLDLPQETQLAWLKQLRLKGWPEQTTRLAQTLINAGQPGFSGLWEKSRPEEINLDEAPLRAVRLQQVATLYQYAGYIPQSLALLASAQDLLHTYLAGIELQRAGIGETGASNLQAAEQRALVKAALISPRLQTDLVLGVDSQENDAHLDDLLPEDTRQPLVLMHQSARLEQQGDLARAQDLARQAVPYLVTQLKDISSQWLHSPFPWDPAEILAQLERLDLPGEAVQCAGAMLDARPTDLLLISQAGRAFQHAGNNTKALELASLAVLIAPENSDFRRRLASVNESSGRWEDCLAEREQVVQMEPAPSTTDWLDLARAAFHARSSERAMQVCEQVLKSEPEQGSAHALVGQILLQKGQREEAANHLIRATLLAPEDPQAWLSLAGIQTDNGEPQRALETLRAAVLAAPGSAELHFAMANACLDNGLPSDALPFLEEAARLDPSSAEIAWKLGKSLHTLGHSARSRKVLEAARKKWPGHPMIAVTDAETLIEAGNQEAAIPGLEVALQSERPEAEWYLIYAKALLKHDPGRILSDAELPDASRLAHAQVALQKLLDRVPGHFEAAVLQAESLQAQKCMPESIAAYLELAERPEAARPEWRWRVQAGFGRSALELGQIDTAVAALRESAQARPEDVTLHQLLTEAYHKANLGQEAAQAARQALQLEPDSLANLSWFIDMMTCLGREQETIDALTTATQLAPENASFWNKLARLKLQRGDTAGTRLALASLSTIESPGAEALREAADTYLVLEDQISALACLEGAANASETISPVLFAEIAGLRARLGNPEGALEALQKASVAAPEEISLHVFQADLLAGLKRLQAAQACLERALRLSESQSEASSSKQTILPNGWSPEGLDESPAGIYTRFALLLRESGGFQAALHHAEKALESQPNNLGLRYLAADLAYGLLDAPRAQKLAQVPELEDDEDETETSRRWRMGLYALQAELTLDAGEDPQAALIIEKGIPVMPEEPRFQAIQSRLMVSIGDLRSAQSAYEAARKQLKSEGRAQTLFGLALDYDRIFGGSSELFISETALRLERWNEALQGFEGYAAQNPLEARAQAWLARGLTLSAEQQSLCQELKSTMHAPGNQALSAEAREKFEAAIQAAGRLCTSSEVSIWLARGRAAFQPSIQQAPAIARLPQAANHAPAILAVLRQSKNAENAIRLVHHYPETPALLVQLALCYSGIDPHKGMEAACKAVELNAAPLTYACLARLAEETGQRSGARQALETALSSWPDEPQWHAWAAKLCQDLGEPKAAISHWEQCLDLAPDVVEHALALGQLYLASSQAARAIDVLERASQLAPEKSEVWMLLAQAHRSKGGFAEALECANQAAALDNHSSTPRLLCGEIALQMGKSDLALEQAHVAQNTNPDDPATILFLSRVLVQKGSLPEGLAVIEKALPRLRPSQPLMLERANLIRRLHGPQSALPVFEELAQYFPQDAAVISLLAQTQADCGDAKAAERSAYTAYHLNPELPQLNFLLGRLQHSAGQLDQAIHFLSEAIRSGPADLEPYLELGQAYLERREHLQALRTYQQAIKVAPRDYRPFYQAAGVLRDSKDYMGAEAMLRRAVELAPEDLNIRRQLGAVVALNLVHNSQEANSVL